MEDPKYIQQLETAHAAWIANAGVVIQRFAAAKEPFTADELWRVLTTPPEPRSLGAALRKAAKDKIIRATGRWVLSTREACHNRPVREWVGV